MRRQVIVLAAALIMAPLGAKAADLVVWWEQGFYAEEDEAVRETIAAFEQDSSKQVALTFHPFEELPARIGATFEAGRPPDIAYGTSLSENVGQWAFDDRLVDLSDAIGHFSDLFDPDALAWWMLLNEKTGQKALYALPIGRSTNHVHVWKSLLEQAGFGLEDIPKEWEAFWAFWCDDVQPAVRQTTGRDDIWAVGLPMSETADTFVNHGQFMAAYEADYVTPDGRLIIDDPEIRRQLVKAIQSYTSIYRKGCTPPDSVTWDSSANNKQFLAKKVVITANITLSIPNALKHERPDDYYENVVTIEWPLGLHGDVFAIYGDIYPAVVFKDGGNIATAKDFIRFLVAEGWLAHYLNFSGERLLPSISKLIDQPFWLDTSDPHRMAAVMQVSSRPLLHNYAAASGNWRHELVDQKFVWPKAIHRVVTEGITPEQAVDEAIARIKEILSE
jgi:multiple sugar transport system substrate-binding protein